MGRGTGHDGDPVNCTNRSRRYVARRGCCHTNNCLRRIAERTSRFPTERKYNRAGPGRAGRSTSRCPFRCTTLARGCSPLSSPATHCFLPPPPPPPLPLPPSLTRHSPLVVFYEVCECTY